MRAISFILWLGAMKNSRLLPLFVIAVILLLSSCQGVSGSIGTTGTPTISVAPVENDYWDLIDQANDAYRAGTFDTAMQIARQAIAINPQENTAWELYTQASIANMGNTYLQEIPDHRYRLPVDVFIRDQVNHTRDWFIVDVREPEEYAAGHIEGAVNIPFRDILQYLNELPSSKTAPILLYCHSQKRATHDLVVLRELGYLKVYNLEGGYEAYEEWMNTNFLPTPGPTPTLGPEEPDFGC